MPLFGSHLSVAGSFTRAIDSAVALGCDTVQIFTKAPSQWAGRSIGDDEAADFRKALKASKLKFPLAHDSYLINLAAGDDALFRKSVDAFVDEIRRADLLGLDYLVTHPGSHVGAGDDAGLARVIEGIDESLARTPDARVRVLIETTAGQGSSLGWRFEQLGRILAGVKDAARLGVCVDSCHIFAAGYALWPEAEYKATMKEFDRVVGLKQIKAWHLNDSKKGLGSRVDRHEHLGRGAIGEGAFGLIVNDKRFARLPMILETAKEDDMDKVNLALLRRLIKSQPQMNTDARR
ncbi:MAG: deoxyribonuclease IV [Gemmataceae bacterium]|nr:deoxyribonuclease IV [Gemmataceae bacterium]